MYENNEERNDIVTGFGGRMHSWGPLHGSKSGPDDWGAQSFSKPEVSSAEKLICVEFLTSNLNLRLVKFCRNVLQKIVQYVYYSPPRRGNSSGAFSSNFMAW